MSSDGKKDGGSSPRTFLARLRRNKSGNVMIMVAASIVPLGGMVGGAIDFSRTYLVKSRMQQACDAAALAGRRSMSGTNLTQADKDEALRFFYFNFPNGTMGSAMMTANDANAPNKVMTTASADKQFYMEATTTVPTTLLKLVNINEMRVNVNCKGEEYYVNTDVMLVMDTTGSMNCYLKDSVSCNQITEKATKGTDKSKMLEIRDAMKQLYTNLRPAQLALEAKQLRMRIGYVAYSSTVNVGKLIYAASSPEGQYIRNPSFYHNSSGVWKTVGTTRTADWYNNTWEGCIEERKTVQMATNAASIPSGATDLDIALMPSSDDTRWAPYDDVTEESESTANYFDAACPKPAVALKSWSSQAEFDAQVDTLKQGDGNTYHDFGMNWGVRMIANSGIFGAKNPDKFNNVKVRRTIVFMTDGEASASDSNYNMYSVAKYSGLVAPKTSSSSDLTNRHIQRFKLMCAKAKSDPLNIDVWVIAALKTTMPAYLSGCASNADQALLVGNTTELANAFKKISDKVGNLRLGS